MRSRSTLPSAPRLPGRHPRHEVPRSRSRVWTSWWVPPASGWWTTHAPAVGLCCDYVRAASWSATEDTVRSRDGCAHEWSATSEARHGLGEFEDWCPWRSVKMNRAARVPPRVDARVWTPIQHLLHRYAGCQEASSLRRGLCNGPVAAAEGGRRPWPRTVKDMAPPELPRNTTGGYAPGTHPHGSCSPEREPPGQGSALYDRSGRASIEV